MCIFIFFLFQRCEIPLPPKVFQRFQIPRLFQHLLADAFPDANAVINEKKRYRRDEKIPAKFEGIAVPHAPHVAPPLIPVVFSEETFLENL